MLTPERAEHLEKLDAALEPLLFEARKAALVDGRRQGILMVYNAIIRYGIRSDDGGPLSHEDMGRRIAETEIVRKMMERCYPEIRDAYPDLPQPRNNE